jgi:hypothetical protein
LLASPAAHRKAIAWFIALAGSAALTLGAPALSQAEESNPNNYSCLGSLSAGTAEAGSDEQQVAYSFYCNGPITGYQLQSQIPVTGIQSPPTVTNMGGTTLADMFSCSGDIPGWAVNCVGAAKVGYETIKGQFAIGSKLCTEPRVDTLLTVTYAYLEKNAVTQAISGPFDLGRPTSCKADALSGGTRLNPKTPTTVHKHGKKAKRHAKKARRSTRRASHR